MFNQKAIAKPKIIIRKPDSIYHIRGEIVNGTFQGRWHFSFGDNYDPEHLQFGHCGSSTMINGNRIPVLGAAQLTGEMDIDISADGDAELLLIDVSLVTHQKRRKKSWLPKPYIVC